MHMANMCANRLETNQTRNIKNKCDELRDLLLSFRSE